MSKLIETLKNLMQVEGYDWEKLYLASTHYIETLSLSSSNEIKEMLQYVYDHYDTETCPFWTRLIAFRLLVAQNPNDEEIKKWAEADATMFGGPEWKNVVKKW